MRSDNINNKDNINLPQMLVKAHDEDAAKCRGVESQLYNRGAKLT
jgi:hypothetical protein